MAGGLKEPDVESAQKDGGGRGRSLLLFAVVTNVLLLVALMAAAAAAGGALLARGSGPETAIAANTGIKMQPFVFLKATSSKLRNATMPWTQFGVGGDIQFDPVHYSLQSRHRGTYYLYVNLHLSCTKMPCQVGRLSLSVGKVLTCDVELGNQEMEKRQSCATQARMEEDTTLLVQMTVTEVLDWKLELKDSNFLMFLMD